MDSRAPTAPRSTGRSVRAFPYAGWCPLGGLAEDLTEPPGLLATYPLLRETSRPDVDDRTTFNVRDSDATLLVILPGTEPSGGTAFTRDEASGSDAPTCSPTASTRRSSRAWLASLPAGMILNVAGPRESKAPGIYLAVTALLDALDA